MGFFVRFLRFRVHVPGSYVRHLRERYLVLRGLSSALSGVGENLPGLGGICKALNLQPLKP